VIRTALPLVMAAALALCAAPAAAQATSKTFKDCPHCPEMVSAAPGTFPHRFAYSKDKVSFGDWKQCVLAGQCPSLGATSSTSPEPVVQISWIDVQQYLLWLSLETGADYRLLSEAEWESLARASPSLRVEGLEWTSDCWHADLSGAPTDGSSWDADGDCRYHVARGRRPGEAAAPVTRRYRFLFNASDASLGFRVARTLKD
jgi:formylglycine-generating enzyme required for sulfatase activity